VPDCPRCRRPLAVARRQCVYCGADVSPDTRDRRAGPRKEHAAPPDAIPETPRPERALVVVALEGVDPARLPAAFGISPYEARQWARRGGYHLQRVAAPADAAAYRERLAVEGITAFTFDEASVRAAAEPEPALGGRFDGQALHVRTPGGSIDVAGADLLLVVKGPITREHLPMEGHRWARTATLDPGFRFHLHRRDPPRPVEIDPATFDLGAHRARESSLLEIAGWITALAAAVPVDDGFRRISPALSLAAPATGPAARLEDALRTSAARPPAVLDNVAQFRFYSGWRGATERQVRPR
jgi:hypothetical protein